MKTASTNPSTSPLPCVLKSTASISLSSFLIHSTSPSATRFANQLDDFDTAPMGAIILGIAPTRSELVHRAFASAHEPMIRCICPRAFWAVSKRSGIACKNVCVVLIQKGKTQTLLLLLLLASGKKKSSYGEKINL